MILTQGELIQILRHSVNVQQEESEVIDKAYLTMTDDDLLLYVKMGISRAYPNVSSISDLPSGADYPITMLAKIELYMALAVRKADKVDMGADNNNYLKQSQRFDHYMKLVNAVKAQYDSWLENEGQGEINTYDVLLDKQHYSRRNYEKQKAPSVQIGIDSVTEDSVSYHWNVSNISHFGRFKSYISQRPIIDMFMEGATYQSKLDSEAELIKSTGDIRCTQHHKGNLEPNTVYYLAVISIERNQVWGYSETSFTTLPVFEDEGDFDSEEIPIEEDKDADSSAFSGEDNYIDSGNTVNSDVATLSVIEHEKTQVTNTIESGE